jgi:hypothetical protein
MTRKKLNLTDIRDFLAYKVENDQETDAEYELYLSLIEEESNIKERYSKLLKQLVRQIREYEEFGS